MAEHNYDYWRAAVAGQKPPMFVDDPQLGFYRKSVHERNAAGNSRRIGYTPVAVYLDSGEMVAAVGDAVIRDRDRINQLWSQIAGNPISEEWFRAVERGEPWPDAHDAAKNKVVIEGTPDRAFQHTEKQFTDPGTDYKPILPASVAQNGESPEQKLARELAEAKAGVSQYEKIDSDTMAGQALSLKNTITSLAGDLDKIREALVRPHIDAQREVNDRINPIIKDAKAQSQTLLRAIGGWEDTKRAAQRAAEEATRRRAEEDRRAKEWHDATPAGSIPEPVKPAEPVKSNAPPPSDQVAAAVGRKASVKVAQFVTGIDLDKSFAQFRAAPEVRAVLVGLAQRAVNAGLPVDGATIEERSVVR